MITSDTLTIGQRTFSSRLLIGTGKYKDLEQTKQAVQASGSQIITANFIRRKYYFREGCWDFLARSFYRFFVFGKSSHQTG